MVTISRSALKARCEAAVPFAALILLASPAKISYTMYNQPAIPTAKHGQRAAEPAPATSPRYPATSITTEAVISRQNSAEATAATAARIR